MAYEVGVTGKDQLQKLQKRGKNGETIFYFKGDLKVKVSEDGVAFVEDTVSIPEAESSDNSERLAVLDIGKKLVRAGKYLQGFAQE